jgi:hypothetical protein
MESIFAEDIALPLDICPGVFGDIVEEQPFKSWLDGTRPWQLHIVGGPGSGKV